MTHKPEAQIEPAVAEWFREEYGEENVGTQVYLSGVSWYCDIVVNVGFGRMYIEVESRASEVRPGLAQAAGYAATDAMGIPLVVTPKDHIDPARYEAYRRGSGVLIREFDTASGTFVDPHPLQQAVSTT